MSVHTCFHTDLRGPNVPVRTITQKYKKKRQKQIIEGDVPFHHDRSKLTEVDVDGFKDSVLPKMTKKTNFFLLKCSKDETTSP